MDQNQLVDQYCVDITYRCMLMFRSSWNVVIAGATLPIIVMKRESLCRHQQPATPISKIPSFICLCKTCPEAYTFCCATCRDYTHKNHSAKVIPLADFLKSLNAFRIHLNRRLKIESKDLEAERVIDKLKAIKNFRLQTLSVEASMLDCVAELGKLHFEHMAQYTKALGQLEQIPTLKIDEMTELVKDLFTVVDYNSIKLKIEYLDPRGRKNKQTKQTICKKVEVNEVGLRQYMVKIIDTTLFKSEPVEGSYSIGQFKVYLEREVSDLEKDIRQKGVILKQLRSRLADCEETFDNAFNLQDWMLESEKIEQILRAEDEQEMQEISRELSQMDDQQSAGGFSNMCESALEDDRSVTCSIDFSKIDQEPLSHIKEKMVSLKIRIKELETENQLLHQARTELEQELTNCNSRVAQLIQERETPSQVESLLSPTVKRLRTRVLEKISILPGPNCFKEQYEEVLGLYNQVLEQHYELKDKLCSVEGNKHLMLEDIQKLRKRVTHLEKQGDLQRKDAASKAASKDRELLEVTESKRCFEEKSLKVESERQQQVHGLKQHIVKLEQVIKSHQKEGELVQKEKSDAKGRSNEYKSRMEALEEEMSRRQIAKEEEIAERCSWIEASALEAKRREESQREQLVKQQLIMKDMEGIVKEANDCTKEFEELILVLQKQKKELIEHNQVLRQQQLSTDTARKLQQSHWREIETSSNKKQSTIQELQEQLNRVREQLSEVLKREEGQSEHLLNSIEDTKMGLLQSNKEKQGFQLEAITLKSQLQQELQQRVKCQQQLEKTKLVHSKEIMGIKEEHIHKLKVLGSEKQTLECRLSQALLEMKALKEQNTHKHTRKGEMDPRVTSSETLIGQRDQEATRSKMITLHSQLKNCQKQLSEENQKNRKLMEYIGQLEARIVEIEQRVEIKKSKIKQKEIQNIINTLGSDLATLEEKLKEKELYQKIYVKELQSRKQEISKLSRENEALRGESVRKEERRGLLLDKENKKIKRGFLSFDQL